jgi:hypothetical protein
MAFALVLFVEDDQQRTITTEHFHNIQPVIKVRILVATVGNQGIERTLGEKETVGGFVDFLSTEVPEVQAEVSILQFLRVGERFEIFL